MKKIATLVLIFALFFSVASHAQQNVGIGTTAPDQTAKLDITSTNQGLLIPRMSTATRNGISSPATSLLIYNTTTDCLEMFTAGTGWVSIGCGCQLPGAFTVSATTGISQSSFSANWSAAAGATGYFLDVSTVSSFATFVTGYSNLSVGNVTTYAVNTGLTCGVTYYYRLRAGNACGTSANSPVTTIALPTCGTGTCGTQVWAAANLNAGTQVNGSSTVAQAAGQKWCYGDIAANCTTYGGLYQWASAMACCSNTATTAPTINCNPCTTSSSPAAVQGECPSGYHIPSDQEWSQYSYCIENTIAPTGTTTYAQFEAAGTYAGSMTAGVGPGDKMKVGSANNPSWPTNGGTNTSGFTALAAGYWNYGAAVYSNGPVSTTVGGALAFFISATESAATAENYRDLTSTAPNNPQIFRGSAVNNKLNGYSVRCLHN